MNIIPQHAIEAYRRTVYELSVTYAQWAEVYSPSLIGGPDAWPLYRATLDTQRVRLERDYPDIARVASPPTPWPSWGRALYELTIGSVAFTLPDTYRAVLVRKAKNQHGTRYVFADGSACYLTRSLDYAHLTLPDGTGMIRGRYPASVARKVYGL